MTCSLLVNSCVYARSASTICCTPVRSCASLVTSVRLRKIAIAPSISPSRQSGMRSDMTETCLMDSRLMLYSLFPVCMTRAMVERG